MKLKKGCMVFLTLCLLLSGCEAADIPSEGNGDVSGEMPPALHTTMLNDLEKMDPNVPMHACKEYNLQLLIDPPLPIPSGDDREIVDENGWHLNGVDLSAADQFGWYAHRLNYASFDQYTIWPEELPEGFDPDLVMEYGRNPGLGIRSLHDEGYTGKGVSIAIIDQALMCDHEEYSDNIMFYERIGCPVPYAQMHGSLVASISAGKTIGVAPDASVYYIATTAGYNTMDGPVTDLNPMAQAIRRILEVNEYLPEEKKIKVISISRGFGMKTTGGPEMCAAIEEAKETGVFVITTSPAENYDFRISGLGREHLNDPDSLSSYSAGLFWEGNLDLERERSSRTRTLYAPMDSRTFAYPNNTSFYAFSSMGGWSNAVPWLAGLYALCLQKNPALDEQTFIDLAFETGDALRYEEDGLQYELNTVVNPRRLLDAVGTDT